MRLLQVFGSPLVIVTQHDEASQVLLDCDCSLLAGNDEGSENINYNNVTYASVSAV